jgi:hypothetical protein
MDLAWGWALVVLAAGLWNIVIWPQFWRRINADERSRDAEGRATAFLRVHAILIGVSFAFGVLLTVLGAGSLL